MATLKWRHLVLYFICFVLLYFSQISGAALIAIFAWFQVCLLLWKINFNLKTQLFTLGYSLFMLPIFVFTSAAFEFFRIYWFNRQGNVMISLLFFILLFLLTYFLIQLAIFNFSIYNEKNKLDVYIGITFTELFRNIKTKVFLSLTFIALVSSLYFLNGLDFKIVISLVSIHLWLQRRSLMHLTF